MLSLSVFFASMTVFRPHTYPFRPLISGSCSPGLAEASFIGSPVEFLILALVESDKCSCWKRTLVSGLGGTNPLGSRLIQTPVGGLIGILILMSVLARTAGSFVSAILCCQAFHAPIL